MVDGICDAVEVMKHVTFHQLLLVKPCKEYAVQALNWMLKKHVFTVSNINIK